MPVIKYVRRPDFIEAIEWDGTNWEEITAWVTESMPQAVITNNGDGTLTLATHAAVATIRNGDRITNWRGTAGVRTNDTFGRDYQPADGNPPYTYTVSGTAPDKP